MGSVDGGEGDEVVLTNDGSFKDRNASVASSGGRSQIEQPIDPVLTDFRGWVEQEGGNG